MPVWLAKLKLADVFHNDDLTLFEKRDEIVKRIRASKFYDTGDEELVDLVDELADADTISYFDSVWNDFYDYADANRIWVETF